MGYGAPMYRDRRPDYVSAWFALEWYKLIFRWVMIPFKIIIIGLLFLLTIIFPDHAQTIILTFFGLMAAVIVVGIVVAVIAVFGSIARASRRSGDWVPPGCLPNPPEPWFNDDGSFRYVRNGDRWRLASDSSPAAAVPPGGRREPSFRR
jgi:hypothetical protein